MNAPARVAACLALLAATACPGPADDATRVRDDGDLVGVDMHEFTPRERHEFSTYVTELPAPCKGVAVPIAQCLSEKRPCAACLPAAQAIGKAVREGMSRDQIENIYRERFDASRVKVIPIEGSPSRGPATALVSIVEFADFECPFCQRIAPELDALCEKHKSDVRFVYKFMPLAMHVRGEPAARAAIAAQAQGKFWEMHQLLFANGEQLDDKALQGYASAIGLDLQRFRADLQAEATTARLDADRKLADALGVKGTPTIFINGREYSTKVDMEDWVNGEITAAQSPR